jgi:hypothetical protein
MRSASPACVSQMPLASPALCVFAGAAKNHAVKIAMMKPNRQAMGASKMPPE